MSGGSWVLYFTDTHQGKVPGDLFFADCRGAVCATPVQVNGPLAPNTSIYFNTVPLRSPQRRWLGYVVGGVNGQELWFLRLDGSAIGPPRRVQLPFMMFYDDVRHGGADERVVAFRVREDKETHAVWLCRLDDDGDCAPERWSPPLAANGGTGGTQLQFSPDGEWLAYTGDPEGDGIDDMMIARTSPGGAGEFVRVSALLPEGFAYEPVFTPDGDTLYYEARDPERSTVDVFAVDLTVDPPGPAVLLTPQGKSQRNLFNADRTAFVRWGGGHELIAVNGTVAAPPVMLHDPTQGTGPTSVWVNDDQSVVYLGVKPDEPANYELFRVDVAGPSAPVRIGDPLAPGVGVEEFPHRRDGGRLFYGLRDDATGLETLWTVDILAGEPPRELTAPLPPAEAVATSLLAIAEGQDRISFTVRDDDGAYARHYLDLAGPSVPLPLGRPITTDSGTDFSVDGARLYFTRNDGDGGAAFMMDVSPSLGEPIAISAPTHDVGYLIVLPVRG